MDFVKSLEYVSQNVVLRPLDELASLISTLDKKGQTYIFLIWYYAAEMSPPIQSRVPLDLTHLPPATLKMFQYFALLHHQHMKEQRDMDNAIYFAQQYCSSK